MAYDAHPTHPAPKAHAAGFVAKALANTHPSDREAVLAYLMEHAALGLGVIRGKAGAAEAVYMLADKMAVAL